MSEKKCGRFCERVHELKRKGLSENEILHEINRELPEEYQLDIAEFRCACNRSKQKKTA